ncbi:MAG TPA: hypothetical protein VFG81_18510 [Anaerolineales bacterium]|nr:hypothetical protein [Anaerolineales bacterium]
MQYSALQTPTHSWLKQLAIAYVRGPSTGVSERVATDLMRYFDAEGHSTSATPVPETDVILTTARLGEPLGWREAFMFTARRRFGLRHVPTVFTIVHATPEQLSAWMAKVGEILKQGSEDAPPFEGVPASASRTLLAQGKRGGAIMYLLRVIQIQTKSIRVLLVVGEDQPQSAFLFDLVGAHPQIRFSDPQAFYKDIATRIQTAASTSEITNHETVEPPIARQDWESLSTIEEMTRASQELGKRDFFTEMIKVSQVAEIPGFSEAISQQYSEGCFATWEPRINGLLTTITGSARPVRKENITDKDLAVIVGIKPARDGALIRKVEDHPNHPPSSEAVEMIGMDLDLPRITLKNGVQVPVIRSKLHGHRGIRSFDWTRAEYVPLPESYLYYPVSCSTDAQYRAVQDAFASSYSLQNPQDPRQVVFTILPGHGVVIVEKWVNEKSAFEVIWEAMDQRVIEITNTIPQGPFAFETHGQRCQISGDASVIDFDPPHPHEH